MKRLLAVLLFAALVGSGAFAQLMFGVTGDLHMDTQLSSQQIMDKFQTGEGIFYGPFAELALGKLGFGLAGTFSFYDYVGTQYMDYDLAGYLSWHFWKAHAFLDPFVELGGGYLATDYANTADDPDPNNPLAANLFWYGAFGLGVNIGPLGVFGKFAYNAAIQQHLTYMDSFGVEQDIPYYMLNSDGVSPYVPPYRVTFGAKFIL